MPTTQILTYTRSSIHMEDFLQPQPHSHTNTKGRTLKITETDKQTLDVIGEGKVKFYCVVLSLLFCSLTQTYHYIVRAFGPWLPRPRLYI